MAMSARNKRKHVEKAMKMLPADGSRPLDYALGGAGSLPPRLLVIAVIGGAFAISAALSFAAGGVVILGALPMLAVYFGVNRPRGVLLTDRGVASFRCGFLNGRPTDLIGVDAATVLDRPTEQRAGSSKVQIGREAVWLTNRDLTRFTTTAQTG